MYLCIGRRAKIIDLCFLDFLKWGEFQALEIDQSNSISCTDSDPVKQLTSSGLSDIHFEDFIQEVSQLRFWILLV